MANEPHEEVEISTEDKAAAIGKQMDAGKMLEYDVQDDDGTNQDDRLGKIRGKDRQESSKEDDNRTKSAERRERRKQRINDKFAAKDALIETLVAANNELNTRVSSLETNTAQQNEEQLKKTYSDYKEKFARAEQEHTEAFSTGDGAKATQAMQKMYDAKRSMDDISEIFNKKPQNKQVQQPRQVQQPQVIHKAVEWSKRNTWFDPAARDTDSKIANTIAADIANEGFDPNSDDFYEELDDRLAQYLPNKVKPQDDSYNDEDDNQQDARGQRQQQASRQERRSPPVSGSGNSSPSRTDNPNARRVTIPTAYKQALIEAGKWDDINVRNRMINKYLETQKNMGNR